ncbi:MAG: hypothetical protein OXE43_04640 [Chloroflexi bacterium]|nr:hypothetical protein [Chloroflexota bacterium]
MREEGYEVGLTLVFGYLREWRRERAEVYVPLVHRPGDEAHFDCFEVTVELAGERRKAWLFLGARPPTTSAAALARGSVAMAEECADLRRWREQLRDPSTLADFAGALCEPCLCKLAAIEVRIAGDGPAGVLTVGTALASIRTAAAAELDRRQR